MAAPDHPREIEAGQIAQALVDFTINGAFPEEAVSTLLINPATLPSAIEALANAKSTLQVPPPLSLLAQ